MDKDNDLKNPVVIEAPATVVPPKAGTTIVEDLTSETADQRTARVFHKAVADEKAVVSEGQRKINVIWEITQAVIATAVTLTTLVVTAIIIITKNPSVMEGAFLLLSNAFFVVISTYLARTNHTKVGGVQEQPRRGE